MKNPWTWSMIYNMGFFGEIYSLLIHQKHDLPFHELKNNFMKFEANKYNNTIAIRKTTKQYLSEPYGQCTDYGSGGQTLDAISHIHCYRLCLRRRFQTLLKCDLSFVDNIIHESDFVYHDNNESVGQCSDNFVDEYKSIEREVRKQCLSLCPKDCFKVEYSYRIVRTETHFGNQEWIDNYGIGESMQYSSYSLSYNYRITSLEMIWDSNEVMIAYIDEPVMTFTDYLVFCGGLMGLWFGLSVNNLIIIVINAKIKQYLHFISIFIKLFISKHIRIFKAQLICIINIISMMILNVKNNFF